MKQFILFCCLIFTRPDKEITVWLVGDSTMSNKQTKAYPETGWGMPFSVFFDSTVIIKNKAINGRSTKTFNFKPVADSLQAGDYVLIQFGHNDASKGITKHTSPDEFKTNLTRFILQTKEKKAIPVLITPVAKRLFDSAGNIMEAHLLYADAVKEVARINQVPLIDLDKESKLLLQKLGAETSKMLYLNLEPGEHPNYPKGVKDITHFNELGARMMAQLVLQEMRNIKLELVKKIKR